MRELLLSPIIKTWPVILAAGGGIWKASEITASVAENDKEIATIQQTLDEVEVSKLDTIDRLARIETKLDSLLEKD